MMIEVPMLHCKRCGHAWLPRTSNPQKCPKCGSYKWNEERVANGRQHVMVSEERRELTVGERLKRKLKEDTMI